MNLCAETQKAHGIEPAVFGLQFQAPRGGEIVDPVIEAGGCRWAWQGKLTEGQFLFFWPGEPVSRYGPALKTPERGGNAPDYVLSAGEYSAKLSF